MRQIQHTHSNRGSLAAIIAGVGLALTLTTGTAGAADGTQGANSAATGSGSALSGGFSENIASNDATSGAFASAGSSDLGSVGEFETTETSRFGVADDGAAGTRSREQRESHSGGGDFSASSVTGNGYVDSGNLVLPEQRPDYFVRDQGLRDTRHLDPGSRVSQGRCFCLKVNLNLGDGRSEETASVTKPPEIRR